MRFILTIEDTHQGVLASLEYEPNEVTNSPDSLAMHCMHTATVPLLDLQKAGLLTVAGDLEVARRVDG